MGFSGEDNEEVGIFWKTGDSYYVLFDFSLLCCLAQWLTSGQHQAN